MTTAISHLRLLCCALAMLFFTISSPAEEASPPETVSYHTQIKPIFQAHCQGCHQPAKQLGGYLMTDFSALTRGGESELAAIVPGDPAGSYLLEQITPVDGEALMPKGKAPLSPEQIELVRRWIEQGASDDTPASAQVIYDADNPPQYEKPPITTALDYSPDGSLLAVAGHHEVLVYQGDGEQLLKRLIGVSDRIESLAFSPDGKQLAVTGGAPARMGEVQIWNVETGELTLSYPITYDTVYGASWSPDGSKVAFGCTDNSLRVLDIATGKEVLFMGSHGDWVLDTAFSVDGSHVVSVGRDQTAKLTEFETARFVDNITSITPGALTGGLAAVARHPERDEILIGGADGVPRTYRMQRLTKRVIGDDANLVRQLPAVTGRIFDVAFSPDAKQVAVCSSLNGKGFLALYSYDTDGALPDDLKKVLEKRSASRNTEENQKVTEYRQAGLAKITEQEIPGRGAYALSFHPDGKSLLVGSTDGTLRQFNSADGQLIKEFPSYPLQSPQTLAEASEAGWQFGSTIENPQALPEAAEITQLTLEPEQIKLDSSTDYVQLLATATLKSGDRVDVTRLVKWSLASELGQVDSSGILQPAQNGTGQLTANLQGHQATASLQISQQEQPLNVDYAQHVTPILSKLGCNQGTCHGSAQGKAGFKLSLRGYDPLFDVRALTDDHASRRTNTAAPDESLMLLKAIGGVPHVGGQLTTADHKYYKVLRNWIANGAVLNRESAKVSSIELSPQNPIIQSINSRQQVRVVATFTDGTQRDVTQESFIESGNSEVATANGSGLLTAVRRGEAPILARYEGAYAATTLTVMGDRTGFEWESPETFNRIDELVAAKWQRMKIRPSELCTDAEFIRRVSIDLTGLPPTAEAVTAFLADERPTQVKRDAFVDYLIGSEDYVAHFSNKWADLLQVNGKFLGREGATIFRNWIREQVAQNRPYDEFVAEILTATGSNKLNPPASYFKVLRTPEDTMENTTHLFLGVRFNCNKCHDHPFERWTQDQYYETAAFFAQYGLARDPENGKGNIGGTAVEAGKPLYEIVSDKAEGEMIHQRTNEVAPPEFPYETEFEVAADAPRREKLAAWMTSADNQYFARSYVNRLWGYLFGVGIIEPIDDIRAGNPPTNPELLDYLTEQFISHDFDVQHVLRLICKSRTYQLSLTTNKWNEDDEINFSHAKARRLSAESLYDAVHQVTGATSKIPGVAPGTRAAELADVQITLADNFLSNFGRPTRESACECERSNEVQLGPIMAMVSGKTVADAIADPDNALPELVNTIPDNRALIERLFLRILNRSATEQEVNTALSIFSDVQQDHAELEKRLAEKEEWWVPVKAEREQQRLAAIEKAQADLAAYEAEIADKVAADEAKRQERIAAAQQSLSEYESALEEPFSKWKEEQLSQLVDWQVLSSTKLTASNKAELKQLEDGSVLATLKDGQGNYQFFAETDLQNITGIRLEALTDPSLPRNGPGLPPDGNFVLTEFQVFATAAAEGSQQEQLKLQNAKADFSQANYDVTTAIDDKMNPNSNGWAVSPQAGKMHWATFEFAKPLAGGEKTKLRFVLHQRYQGKQHWLGRFRISLTASAAPVPLSLPQQIATLLTTENPTAEQQRELLEFFKRNDDELAKRRAGLAEAKKPLPIDPKVTQLKKELALSEMPVPVDPALARLRNDVEMSNQLLTNGRLTAAQDLAWALINSPSFLFNR